MSDLIEFGGEQFRMAERIGLMALMRFAKIARGGVDSAHLDGLTAMYDLLEQCLADDEWERFQQTALKTHADSDELMKVVADVIKALAGRPTSRPSDSSDGPTSIEQNSKADSSSAEFDGIVSRLEAEGRPDQAYMVRMAQRAKATSAA